MCYSTVWHCWVDAYHHCSAMNVPQVFRWRSSARTSTATTRARRWVPSTAPAPSACPWPPTSTAPTASRSSTAPPPTHRAPARSHQRSCRCLRAPPSGSLPAPRRTRWHRQSARRRPCAGQSRSTSSSTSTTSSRCRRSRSPSRSPTQTTTLSLPCPPMEAAATVDTTATTESRLPPAYCPAMKSLHRVQGQ